MAGREKRDGICKICKLTYAQHSGNLCKACFVPIEHHTAEEQEECWLGRSRMAFARGEAGLDLNDADLEAMKRYPEPESLTPFDGYKYVESAHAQAPQH